MQSSDKIIRKLRKTDPNGITYAIFWFLSTLIVEEYKEFIAGLEDELSEENRCIILEAISIKKAEDYDMIRENYDLILKLYNDNKEEFQDSCKTGIRSRDLSCTQTF
jgi:restriction endonuclease